MSPDDHQSERAAINMPPEFEAYFHAMRQEQESLRDQLAQQQQQFLELQAQFTTPQPTNSIPVREPRARLPDPFDGSTSTLRGFINQILLVIQQQPATYATETSRVLLLGSLLTGLAREWFNPYFEAQDPLIFNNFQQFLYIVRQRFDDPNRGNSAADTLSSLKQGRRPVAAYASQVQQLVVDAGWDERAPNMRSDEVSMMTYRTCC